MIFILDWLRREKRQSIQWNLCGSNTPESALRRVPTTAWSSLWHFMAKSGTVLLTSHKFPKLTHKILKEKHFYYADTRDVLPEIDDLITRGNSDSCDILQVANVTLPVQCMVEDGRLYLCDGTKSGITGFYDPCGEKEEKQLLLRYKFRNVVHQVVIPDSEQLRCPRVNHQLPQ